MKNKIIQIFLAFLIFLIAFFVPFENKLINSILFFVSYIVVGFEVIQEAFEHFFKGKFFDENCLMLVATLGALIIGEYPEATAVMLFYQIGEMLQDYAVDKSKRSITKLMDIRPDFAYVKRNNKVFKVNPNEVNLGETIIVKPGEKVPLDGTIIEGSSLLDTSSLTGESVPKEVTLGDTVLSGCINQTSLLTIKVAKKFKESTVSKILDLVENASSKKSKSENFITKFAKYYTPIVVFIAFILALVPPFVLHISTFQVWFYRALTFLVVSCPCALVLSIPLGFFAGIGSASKIGILVKGGNYLERLANSEIVVFDKTGTLTKGTFEVQKIEAFNISEEELLELASYSENYSNHPISLSLKNAYKKEIDTSLISDFEEVSGFGISCKVDNKSILIGNEKWMKKNNIDYIKSNEIGTILYVALEKKFVGSIIIADQIKEDSKYAISNLKKQSIKKTVMLTGDKKEISENVAMNLGIDEVYAELLPTDKAEKLEEIINSKSSNGNVVFVGDGMNDSPVLALSDVGVAMGMLSSDSSIEAADVVIMTDEPSKLCNAINLSRKTMTIVRQNIVFAIFVKLLVLVLSAFGLSTMWSAVFADVGVSIICVLNSLRILYAKL